MSMLKEFREFAMRGNVVDLAVGVIIGGAFGKIVNSLANDVIMPPIGLLLGGVDFKGMYTALDGKTYENLEAAVKAKAPVIAYGMFIQNVVEFVILAFVIFMMVRAMNKMRPGVASDKKAGG